MKKLLILALALVMLTVSLNALGESRLMGVHKTVRSLTGELPASTDWSLDKQEDGSWRVTLRLPYYYAGGFEAGLNISLSAYSEDGGFEIAEVKTEDVPGGWSVTGTLASRPESAEIYWTSEPIGSEGRETPFVRLRTTDGTIRMTQMSAVYVPAGEGDHVGMKPESVYLFSGEDDKAPMFNDIRIENDRVTEYTVSGEGFSLRLDPVTGEIRSVSLGGGDPIPGEWLLLAGEEGLDPLAGFAEHAAAHPLQLLGETRDELTAEWLWVWATMNEDSIRVCRYIGDAEEIPAIPETMTVPDPATGEARTVPVAGTTAEVPVRENITAFAPLCFSDLPEGWALLRLNIGEYYAEVTPDHMAFPKWIAAACMDFREDVLSENGELVESRFVTYVPKGGSVCETVRYVVEIPEEATPAEATPAEAASSEA